MKLGKVRLAQYLYQGDLKLASESLKVTGKPLEGN